LFRLFKIIATLQLVMNPYPANVENMASS